MRDCQPPELGPNIMIRPSGLKIHGSRASSLVALERFDCQCVIAQWTSSGTGAERWRIQSVSWFGKDQCFTSSVPQVSLKGHCEIRAVGLVRKISITLVCPEGDAEFSTPVPRANYSDIGRTRSNLQKPLWRHLLGPAGQAVSSCNPGTAQLE